MRRRRLIFNAAILLATATIALTATQTATATDSPLTLTDDQGVRHTLAAIDDGRPTAYIVIKGGWCSVCTDELGRLAAKAEALRAKGVQVVGVSLDGVEGNRALMARARLPFVVFFDEDAKALRALEFLKEGGKTPVPGVFFTDGCGEVVEKALGRYPGQRQDGFIVERLLQLERLDRQCNPLM